MIHCDYQGSRISLASVLIAGCMLALALGMTPICRAQERDILSANSVGVFGGGELEKGQLTSYLMVDGFWPHLVWANTKGTGVATVKEFAAMGWGVHAFSLGEVRVGAVMPVTQLDGTWKFKSDKSNEQFKQDGVLRGDTEGWARKDYDDHAWRDIPVPGEWISLTGEPGRGFAWYRRTFNITEPGRYLLQTNGIDDIGTIYINGKKVGVADGYRTPYQFDVTDFISQGSNTIAICVDDLGGGAGITSPLKIVKWVDGAPASGKRTRALTWTGVTETLQFEDQQTFTYQLSRLSPAFYVKTSFKEIQLLSGLAADGQGKPTKLALPLADGIHCFDFDAGLSHIPEMSESWMLVWFNGASGWPFDIPMLVVLEHKPQTATWQNDGLSLQFGGACGAVAILPLQGVRRVPFTETGAWQQQLPSDIATACRFWNRALKAYPIAARETFTIDREHDLTTIRNQYTYQVSQDDWKTEPLQVAPLPPVLSLGIDEGYPAKITGKVESQSVSTFAGPYRVQLGDHVEYTLPGASKYINMPTWLPKDNGQE